MKAKNRMIANVVVMDEDGENHDYLKETRMSVPLSSSQTVEKIKKS